MPTQRFELSTLRFLAQCSYGLSYRTVLIWLVLSDYYCQITIILDLIEILIQSGSPDNCYQLQQEVLDRNAVVDIHHLKFWENLLTNKQTNKQTDKQKNLSTHRFELSNLAFLAQCSYRLSYRAVLIWLLLSDYYYHITIIRLTKKFGHTEVRTLDPRVFSTMLLTTELSGRRYLITLIRLLLSDYYYTGPDWNPDPIRISG